MIIQPINEAKTAAHGDYRIIRRNGAVVAFEPAKIARAMKRYMTVAESNMVERSLDSAVAASVLLDDGSDTAGASPEAGGESGGDDDDGDGDGDGPRRSRYASPTPKVRNTPAAPRLPRSIPTKATPISTPHRDALVALVLLTTIVLLTGVVLAMLGFPKISASVIASLTGLPWLAAKFIRPK
ncbi:hypothetical protein JAB5_00250 [Janthinobacterium sp. HH103]|uniref:hypothetical protein n=1 Tax=unclassified Janthinobacterium TaxID=2610881 RepID=UPI000892B030|nr:MULTISPECIES: hypothetical protein [unclassified Janthinobacterium]OEZ64375.1 hypothetical protein JAB2_42250 [Janthinobacterium sp. HH100]OEZ89649.1 hypothetical protein JAB5_00250 [Janthinobacterium sp. HH103]QOU70907.1 hypothetical protein JAB4_003000 [Janthinobacterium sp. HH102]